MAAQYDAIIIGAGHNGLVCGSYLAKAGLKTLVLERRAVIGGAAVTEEIAPGFRASIFSYVMSLLHPRVIAELELRKFGLEVLPANDLFCPLYDGDYIVFSEDMKKTQAEFARFSRHDAEIYPAFDAYLQEAANIVRKLLFETPVDPSKRDWKSFKSTAALLWRIFLLLETAPIGPRLDHRSVHREVFIRQQLVLFRLCQHLIEK